ncbi:MAG: chemotaxis protein CheW [Bdellovibrionaceae bacterium]|nr:chemotaxis protein CheW [Pseudobdellovibrionaceae bacterium]NUM58752.1 purine-binding chemotaxis protein CheW [Pseudobdellovibrionaceae bacterium]
MSQDEVNRYLNFSLGEEEFAIPLLSVKEVIAVPETTPISHTPPHFLGIMNLRGQVISVIDLRKKFSINTKNTEETSVIILDLKNHFLGVVVDSVTSVLAIKNSDILEKPMIESSKSTEYITGVFRKNEHLVLLLDIFKTLSQEDKSVISKSATKAAA